MKALVLTDAGLRLDANRPEPQPRDDDALVRVLRAGICGTDLELLHGYKGFRGVPGHEFVGVVERCAAKPELVGRRVVAEINAGCRTCERCRGGDERHCARRTVLGILGRDGAFAELLAVPARNLLDVGDLAPEIAVFTEPLAAALRAGDSIDIDADPRVVVLGAGRLGHLVAAAMRIELGHVELVGRNDRAEPDADVVVDCTGSPEGFARAVDLVRPRGKLILKSTCGGEAQVPASLLTKVVVNEIDVVGSRCGYRGCFRTALILLGDGKVDVAPLVEATYRLAEFARAFEHAARPGALKVLLDPT